MNTKIAEYTGFFDELIKSGSLNLATEELTKQDLTDRSLTKQAFIWKGLMQLGRIGELGAKGLLRPKLQQIMEQKMLGHYLKAYAPALGVTGGAVFSIPVLKKLIS